MVKWTKMRWAQPAARRSFMAKEAAMKNESGSLYGKRVVVLGGSSGIGYAVAARAAEEGARCVVVSSRKESVDRAVSSLGLDAEGYVADLTVEAAVQSLFERIGAFDHLVFTAGEALTLGLLAETSIADAQRAFGVRFWGALAAVKHARPFLREGGSIVLTSGIASARPQRGWSVGASVCGAMDAFARALAVELAPIRVNAVSPGVVRSPLWKSMTEEARDAMYRTVGDALLVGRVGEPGDIAETYLYAMKCGFATGQTYVVDGGALLV
jgi:NAD(P)-dependent dehydrogenase (short-subunit alcohol dehydrogenase family)